MIYAHSRYHLCYLSRWLKQLQAPGVPHSECRTEQNRAVGYVITAKTKTISTSEWRIQSEEEEDVAIDWRCAAAAVVDGDPCNRPRTNPFHPDSAASKRPFTNENLSRNEFLWFFFSKFFLFLRFKQGKIFLCVFFFNKLILFNGGLTTLPTRRWTRYRTGAASGGKSSWRI